ncbi:MAG: PilZ domain-containing protein [Planctomycetota bacterium]
MQEYIDKLQFELQRAKFTERRTEPRQPFVRPVTIHLPHGPSIPAFSKDLSAQGIGVITETQFQPNSLATLEIHSTTGDPVLLRSEARWCDAYGKGWYLVGWKFIGVGIRPMP